MSFDIWRAKCYCTRNMMPAAVSQTEIKMDMSWASLWKGLLGEKITPILFHLMEVEVFSMLRYCRMSGTDIRRRARKNPNPEKVETEAFSVYCSPIHVRSRYMETIDWGMVKKSTKDSSSSMNQNLSEAAMNLKINNESGYFHHKTKESSKKLTRIKK